MINYHNEMMRIECDECGCDEKISCFDFRDGIKLAKKRGRTVIPRGDEWEHYCNDCAEALNA